MDFEEVIQRLKNSLSRQLPGKEAQMRMSPQPVDMRRFDTKLPSNYRKGAVLILIYPQEKQAFFPLIKRPEYIGVHSGQIAFPGGKMDEGDENEVFTALREAEEEVAVNASKVEVLGRMSDLFIPASNFLVSPVIGYVDHIPEFVPEEREVQRIISARVADIISPEIQKKTILEIGNQIKLDTPYFEVEKEMVWGATAMILGEFIELLEKGK
ncbi:MAG TPA: coenzyme A pyrophosphatase [Algoriphagus sp.]|jgi:8-oxo-dGTP pyrophosphatase MutT (NUDIX family)|uniref:NUDIX hydrolase n=1 Tax=unclassified Algoriphagus TaxID=2641541 RepID=UPI000C3F57DD|nr:MULTISPECIES: CoA pyrophosphatase [unclassified Algoriphagus]MAL14681.1 coenzyme A pyrophosphatase [Algoriphagus sp.]MAN86636.1 coenzyme A pyrophosphatase [Algoriphagus sp.]HAS57175.1 coenzyme A pyrophosphatase [Algoriphagus sp.]HAZ26616.1 coenzyme A pyrophosphatase [Algoriphagus sp.]HCB47651.1 coenzyme A pyrophosphatase [Algoriphagus sp.]|tara:strand:+ start:49 stop:684 length:636 start_codon:yes stop_codon:yes gene_type:complete